MKKINSLIGMVLFLLSNQALANWSGYIAVKRVEIHNSGVYLAANISDITAPDCTIGRTYIFAQFPSSNEKLADRALSSVYYAQSTSKKIRVSISSCSGDYAVATGIWIE
jgi:hypothetical protein